AAEVARRCAAAPQAEEETLAAQIESIQRRASMAKFVWPIPDKGLQKRLHRITAPTLVLWGDADRANPVVYAEEWQRRVKGGALLLVPGGHMVLLRAPDTAGAAVATLGPLGIMVNAAGILDGYAPADELTLPVWERVIGINLTGTFVGCKRALVEMLPRSAGRIVNIASVAGVVGSGGGPAYVASKHGVVGLTRQLAVAYAARGVTVNAICPGAIATGLRANSTRILGRDAPEMRGIGGDDAAVRAITPAVR